jgi:Rrf2 family protein
MLKFNSDIRYGLRATLYLAKKKDLANVKEISQAEKIPADYLEHLLLKLKQAGILNAKRGQTGGYFIAKNQKNLDLAKIFTALDENLTKIPCQGVCSRKKTCQAKTVWQTIDQNFKASLKNINLSQLIHPVK